VRRGLCRSKDSRPCRGLTTRPSDGRTRISGVELIEGSAPGELLLERWSVQPHAVAAVLLLCSSASGSGASRRVGATAHQNRITLAGRRRRRRVKDRRFVPVRAVADARSRPPSLFWAQRLPLTGAGQHRAMPCLAASVLRWHPGLRAATCATPFTALPRSRSADHRSTRTSRSPEQVIAVVPPPIRRVWCCSPPRREPANRYSDPKTPRGRRTLLDRHELAFRRSGCPPRTLRSHCRRAAPQPHAGPARHQDSHVRAPAVRRTGALYSTTR